MADIFLSYAREDRAFTMRLAEELAGRGWSVWCDSHMYPGQAIWQVIQTQIDAAKCVIVLWSKASIRSTAVQNEADEGATRNILLPVRMEDVRIPLQFRHLHTADLIGEWSEEKLGELAAAIERLVPRP